jgi:purine-binding chemotaxis protein CheW
MAASPKLQQSQQMRQCLTFVVHGELFSLDIACVKEIIEYHAVTHVPLMPAFMKGVINLRGQVVPVVDLACRLGYGHAVIGKRSCIVVVEIEAEGEQHEFGMLVDAVSEVIEVAQADIEPAPSFGANIRADFIAGMVRRSKGFLVLLAIDRVLSLEELAQIIASRIQASALDQQAFDQQVSDQQVSDQ